MHFCNFRKYSVKTKMIEICVCLFEKRRMNSVSGRHNDYRLRNTTDVSLKRSHLLIISDIYRVFTEIAEVLTDIARSILKCIGPCYLT